MIPRLSFIVPVYSPDMAIFEKCLKALLAQSLQEWEAIFVLDGPCPEARDAILRNDRKSNGKFRIVEIPHGGACRARNEGAKLAAGQYWVFFDCDCVIEPGASRLWVDILDKKPAVGFVYSGYKFLDNRYAIDAQPWDPYLLRVRNFISTCFPLRKELFPGWCEDLESLQDWDFWLSVLEKAEASGYDPATVGAFREGYAFATSYPKEGSISAKGCAPENWLSRMDAVKARHGFPERQVCVSSLGFKIEGIRLAKLIGADYQDVPNDKPHRYNSIIQVGFSLLPGAVERHSQIFSDQGTRKFLFWMKEDIDEIYERVSFSAIDSYSRLLNSSCRQFVEDKAASRALSRAGFKVEIMPLPTAQGSATASVADGDRWLVDISKEYGHVFQALDLSLPDFKLETLDGAKRISDYAGILCFHPARTLNQPIKRMLLSGRHVISNVQQPFCGYVEDGDTQERLMSGIVDGIRKAKRSSSNAEAANYCAEAFGAKRLLEAMSA